MYDTNIYIIGSDSKPHIEIDMICNIDGNLVIGEAKKNSKHSYFSLSFVK